MGLLPSEEIIGLGRGSPSVDFSGGMPSKIPLHAVAVRERVGGLGLAVVCAGRQCERTASVLPVRGLPGSIIALVVKDTADGVLSQILKGAQVTAMESDSAVSVIETGSSGQRTQQMLDHLADKVNGVILSTDAPSISFIRDYAKRVPLVVLNRPLEGVASVVPDPRIGTVRAEPAETLAVTYVAGPAASWANQSRWAAVHDIGNRMGFKVNQIGPVHPTVEGGYQAALALEGGDTTAIITYNDLIAVGIVLRFTADGVNVPGDVSVIGFDNTLIAPVVTPPITSIRIPRVQLGQVAVRRLLLMMISPMILLGVFLWIPGMPFGIYVFACWRCTWEMTPETAGFGAHARGEKRDGHVGMAGWLRRARLVLREYASTLRVKEFRKHLAIYLLVQVTMDVFGQTFVFFVVHDWTHTAAFASLMPGCGRLAAADAGVRLGDDQDRPETAVRDQFHRLAWHGLAVRGVDAGRHAAGTVVDGVRGHRLAVVLRVQIIVWLPAVGGVPVNRGHRPDRDSPVPFRHVLRHSGIVPSAGLGNSDDCRRPGAGRGRLRRDVRTASY